MHFSDQELNLLSIVDLIIVYLFCLLQIYYNSFTAYLIYHSKSKVKRSFLWRAYLFAFAPIVYSILPILLVLYFYVPSNNSNINLVFSGYDEALFLVYLHLPPIILVFIIIFIWNIICTNHNKKIDSLNNLIIDQNVKNYYNDVKSFYESKKIVFRKIIWQWFNNTLNEINKASTNKEIVFILSKIEGWYISKRRFEFFWCTKKANKWIKKYYLYHYLTLREFAKEKYEKIK